MEEKYLAAKQKLEQYHQEHLLNFFFFFFEKEKVKLLDDILTIDFSQMEDLFELTKKGEVFKDSKIEPISYIEKAKISEENRKNIFKLEKKLSELENMLLLQWQEDKEPD